MNTPIEVNTEGDRIVYVKTVEVADLPHDLREQAGNLDHLYAVHDSDVNMTCLRWLGTLKCHLLCLWCLR